MARSHRSLAELQALIRDLDARCRARLAVAPDPNTPLDHWMAVLFLVRTQPFLTPLAQVSEVLELPRDLTRVPGTKPWLIGIANNRGVLLPIFHLAAFIEGTQTTPQPVAPASKFDRRREKRNRERVLIVRQDELPCGLIVSEAIGMRAVPFNTRLPLVPEGLGASQPYVEASFLVDNAPVPVLQLGQLITDPLFNAATV
ncbi:chemotaxis protein CheW [Chromatium okenii]|uniref:chemotaxis protein CheW n=1 Tax=Chromatium okenii TaxID=61644 RepID=UPI001906846E|nr:chemotaxis protein CheW [Chromatium okenii]MBK1641365.1 chemotaxis protein CheW [Chromatium okenii]